MTNYKVILMLSALFISGLTKADKNKGTRNVPFPATHKVQALCLNTTAQVDLDINNVRARILNGGDLWWDPIGQVNYYEVPIGSNKNSLYTGAIWISGYDASGALKAAAQTYRQAGSNDFWAGPTSKDPGTGVVTVTDAVCNQYDRFWVLTKQEVADFANGGEATAAIKDYPGNGNVGNNELQFLAPFFDNNNDGIYNYTQGDYPYYNLSGEYAFDTTVNSTVCNDYLFGDKTLWWVFNDVGNIHGETGSDPIGLEIRAQAFAFKTNDEINNMTFYKFQIINRTSDSLLQTYMGAWADPDLGNAADDYVGCDVNLGLGFCYNGDPDDEGSAGYGLNPPAVGIDFFQGPLADAFDGIDNDRDGTTDEAGEQIAMSKFVYYRNVNNVPDGNPATTDDYYQYLDGVWLDGQIITRGENGRNPANPPTNFMFPGTTDPAFPGDWTMATALLPVDDMRFIESAGKFSLAPGAVNYVTTGVVWERTSNGGPLASLNLVKLADQKAQSLFDNCFKVLDGPDAPNLVIRELDQSLTISLENTKNKRVEQYNEIDPSIPPSVLDDTVIVQLSTAEKSYRFQGYKLYQLRDKNVSSGELNDVSKARLVRQMDINDNITEIVNFELDQNINFFVPVKKTDNVNAGLAHSITVTNDLFTGQKLINYRPYYYMAISYAYNNFRQFDEDNPNLTQENPYFPGRLNIRVYSGIPHKPLLNNGGTTLNSSQGPLNIEIKRIEGQGNGGNILDLTEATSNEILTDPLHRSFNPVYTAGHGPLRVGIYDPFKVKGGEFAIKFNGVGDTSLWKLIDRTNNADVDSSGAGIAYINEEIITSKGLTIAAYKVPEPGMLDADENALASNNGLLDASIQFMNGSSEWLTGVQDVDDGSPQDWIRAGINGKYGDPDSVYDRVLGGTWAPYVLTEGSSTGPKIPAIPLLDPQANSTSSRISWSTLNSVDIVITPDKSKWSRTIVFNTGPLNRFNKRRLPSLDKNGLTSNNPISNDPNDANFIDSIGMSWFPGYAINVETGERLNIAFGEDSTATGDNGNDMLWNPTHRVFDDVTDTIPVFGGKHYIYIFNRYFADTTARIPNYDNGWRIDSLIRTAGTQNKIRTFKSCIWTSLPVLSDNSFSFQGNVPPGEVKVRLRVAKSYLPFVSINAAAINNGNPYYEFSLPGSISPTFNVTEVAKSAIDNVNVVPNPYYSYSSYEKTREDQLDNRIRFINLPSRCTVSIYTLNGTLIRQLKRDVGADVSEGQAVEEGQDFNLSSTLDWDLKNTAGIPIASGVYIIHIDAGSLGEKVIKWFGVMRPLDLDTF